MNNGHLEDELLQRYFDGELSNESAVEVSQHLESCETCRKRHRSLERLHAFINMTVEEAADEVDFDALYGQIESGVEQTGAFDKEGTALAEIGFESRQVEHRLVEFHLPEVGIDGRV